MGSLGPRPLPFMGALPLLSDAPFMMPVGQKCDVVALCLLRRSSGDNQKVQVYSGKTLVWNDDDDGDDK